MHIWPAQMHSWQASEQSADSPVRELWIYAHRELSPLMW